MNIKRVLVANRGAIAVRVIRTLRKMNIESVAVYHSDEKNALYTRMADFAIDLGGGTISDTFLNIDKLVSIAINNACNAIHPGYGFLSENHLFAKACEQSNVKLIGPESSVIRLMGLKSKAKEVAIEAKVPVIESHKVSSENFLIDETKLPVLIKAVAGGGGRGMKIVRDINNLNASISSAKREALQYFGNDELMLEPFLEGARHIEVQILGNEHGEIIHLFERECSLQRNQQKIIEEAPAPNLSDELKEKLYAAAVRFAAQLNYTGAGTVEFLVKDEDFWFLEMNTRIQVEHAVSELITNTDIVEEQINIANGKRFSKELINRPIEGHAIEARVYAENPYANFQPSAGKISYLRIPNNIRFDTYIENNTQITPHFDSLLGKLIVYDKNRDGCLSKLKNQLNEIKVLGIKTNISYLSQVVRHPKVIDAKLTTNLIEKEHKEVVKQANDRRARYNELRFLSAFIFNNFLRNGQNHSTLWKYAGPENNNRNILVTIEGAKYAVEVLTSTKTNFTFLHNNNCYENEVITSEDNYLRMRVNDEFFECYFTTLPNQNHDLYSFGNFVYKVSSINILRMASSFMLSNKSKEENELNQIRSSLFGKVIDVLIKEEQEVKKGDVLLTIESMKTENNIIAHMDGIINSVFVKKDEQVAENMLLTEILPIE